MARLNIYADEPWDMNNEERLIKGRHLAVPLGAKELGGTLYELLPGSPGFHLHAHYGLEEMFYVLSGTPTLRTATGEESLSPGDVVFCPTGPEGLHTFTNPTDEPARMLAISVNRFPEIVLYPERGKFGVATRDPLAPVAEGEHQGIIGLFDLPES